MADSVHKFKIVFSDGTAACLTVDLSTVPPIMSSDINMAEHKELAAEYVAWVNGVNDTLWHLFSREQMRYFDVQGFKTLSERTRKT